MFKTKPLLIALGATLLAGLGIGIFISIKRKKGSTTKAKIDRSQIPNGWTPDLLAKNLFDAMNGVTFSNSDSETALEELSKLNDEQFKSVYNHFNTNYADEAWFEAGSLRDWINSESGLASANIGFATLNRMDRLSLT